MTQSRTAAVEIPRSRRLVHAGLWISALTVASKVFGVAREGMMAWAFGTSAIVDAFRLAQTAIFLLIHILTGSTLDSAFVPTFKHLLSSGRRRIAWRTARLAGRALAIVGAILFVAVFFGRESWVRLLAPGFDPERVRLTSLLLSAMAIGIPLGLASNLMIAISNGLYRFKIPAFRPLVQNVAILGGIIAALKFRSQIWLGASIPIGLAVMIVLLAVSLRPVARPRGRGTSDRDTLIWRFFGLALVPGMALVLLEQANLIVERIVASRLSEGSIASLDYARLLVETPLVTLGVGITQTLLPTLSDLSATGDRERFFTSVRLLLLACLWALLPVSVWLLSFGTDVIRVVYARGAFDERSVATTSAALSGFAIGLWAWFGGTILQRAYYAQRRLRALLPLTAAGLGTFGVLSVLWAPRMGVHGISLAFSVANVLYFTGSLALLGLAFARTVLPLLLYLLAGGGLLRVAAPHLIPAGAPPFVRAVGGALLLALLWIGWTAIHPSTRALARRLINPLRRSP